MIIDDIFMSFAPNTNCGYMLDPPRQSGSNKYPETMIFGQNKYNNINSIKPKFFFMKSEVTRVFIIRVLK